MKKLIFMALFLSIMAITTLSAQAIYGEGFEGSTFPPLGWVNSGVTRIAAPGTGNGSWSAFLSDKTKFLVLPKMANPFYLTVYAYQSGTGNCVPEFSTSPNANGPWTPRTAFTNISNGVWVLRFGNINPVPPNGVFLKLGMTSNSNTAVYFDNITIRPQAFSYVYESVSSGNWNDPTIWRYYLNGSPDTWYNATAAPTDTTAFAITVKTGHNVSVAVNARVDQVTVEAGGTLTVANGVTLNVFNGDGVDLSVNGTLATIGTGVVSGIGSLAINAGATLNTGHAQGISTTPATGAIQLSGGATYSNTANYIYSGSVAQVTGNALPSSVNNLSITNTTNSVTLTAPVTVNGSYNMSTGAVLNASSSNILSFGATATFSGTGTVNNHVRQLARTISASGLYSNSYMGLSVTAGASAVNSFTGLKTDIANTVVGRNSISRTWNLAGSTSTASAITLTWPTGADNSNSFASGFGTVWRYTGSAWERVGTHAVTTSSGFRSITFNYTLGTASDFTVLAPNPVISASSLSNFGLVKINTTSSTLSFTSSGLELYSNLVISAPTGFQISTSSGSGFGASVSLAPSNGAVASTPIYVRFSPTVVGPFSQVITNTSTGATTVNVTAAGTGIDLPVIISPAVASVNRTSASIGATISNLNYSNVSTRGIYWSLTNGFADGTGNIVSESSDYGTGAFSIPVYALTPNTTYYFKAFATNAAGTTYTGQSSFTTLTNHYYRTTGSGDWDDNTLWEYSADGNIWAAAPDYPDFDALGITIRSGNTIDMNLNVALDDLVIDNGGTLHVASGITMTVMDGTGTDVVVNGSLNLSGNLVFNPGATIAYGAGANLIYSGSSSQTVGAEWPETTTISITNNNSVGLMLNENKTNFNGNFANNGILNTGNHYVAGTGSFVNTGQVVSTVSNPVVTDTFTQPDGSVIEYTNDVTLPTPFTYQNLVLNSSLTNFDLGGDISVNETFTTQNGASLDLAGYRMFFPFKYVSVGGTASITAFSPETYVETPALPNSVGRKWTFSGAANTTTIIYLHWDNPQGAGLNFANGSKIWRFDGNAWIEIAITAAPVADGATRMMVSFPVSFGGKADELSQYGVTPNDQTLPVELSSFSATLTASNLVQLRWVTQSETNCSGYYIYRGDSIELMSAELLNVFIPATNTSQTQNYVYTDTDLVTEGVYYYWLSNRNFDGSSDYHGPISVFYSHGGGGSSPEIPITAGIKSLYPNPFNPILCIEYGVTEPGTVNIQVFNQRGQLVRNHQTNSTTRGTFKYYWDGKADNGAECSSGVYTIRLNTGTRSYSGRAILSK